MATNNIKTLKKYFKYLKTKEDDDIIVFWYVNLFEIGEITEEQLINGMKNNQSTNYNVYSNLQLIDTL